jgi:hypothetical protein
MDVDPAIIPEVRAGRQWRLGRRRRTEAEVTGIVQFRSISAMGRARLRYLRPKG